jgi:glycosyltransferase involved in cell wall biosynthesis
VSFTEGLLYLMSSPVALNTADRALHASFALEPSPPPKSVSLSVLTPVYNERHLVAASLARVLALESDAISRLELIAVDDCSTDGSWEVLQQLADCDPRLQLVRHPRNMGKGAAIRTALARATGDVCMVHDADMEYNPTDIPALLRPFINEGADAVFGSRYMSAPYRRALMHRHTMVNKTLTTISNWFTDLSLSDIETCYKLVNTRLLKSMPLRSDDFRFEIEVTFKLAKRRARVFEVPIRYLPRSHEEGKKIRATDGILAIAAMLKYWLIDDIYAEDQYGSSILANLQSARRFNKWMADVLRPYVGDRVLEIGAGIGTLTGQFIPRDLYVASDINPVYVDYLGSYAMGKPYLHVSQLDVARVDGLAPFAGTFDTVLMINVLEHVGGEQLALHNVHSALAPGGRAVILVPQHPRLYNSLDVALEHRERYTADGLRASLERGGFRVQAIFDFNRTAVPGWWFNGKVLRRKRFSRVQLKMLELLMPAIRRMDWLWPWKGLSLVGVGLKP